MKINYNIRKKYDYMLRFIIYFPLLLFLVMIATIANAMAADAVAKTILSTVDTFSVAGTACSSPGRIEADKNGNLLACLADAASSTGYAWKTASAGGGGGGATSVFPLSSFYGKRSKVCVAQQINVTQAYRSNLSVVISKTGIVKLKQGATVITTTKLTTVVNSFANNSFYYFLFSYALQVTEETRYGKNTYLCYL